MAPETQDPDDTMVARLVSSPIPEPGMPAAAWLLFPWLWQRRADFPSREEISRHAGCNPGTATRWLTALAEAGFLTLTGRRFAINEDAVARLLGNSVVPDSEILDFRGFSGALPSFTTTTTTTPPAQAERPSTHAPSTPQLQPAAQFVQQVVEVLTFHEIRARVEINGHAILEFQRKGMTLELASAAANATFNANKRTFRYWGGVVDRKLEQRSFVEDLERGNPVGLRVVSP